MPSVNHAPTVRQRHAQRRLALQWRDYAAKMALDYYFHSETARQNLEAEDLLQEAWIGLGIAAERFDPKRGYQFSTYAHWWILQRIRNAVRNARLIHVPSYVLGKGKRATEGGRKAAESVRKVYRIPDNDHWEGRAEDCPPDYLELDRLQEALAGLTKEEREVIEGRYGVNGHTEETLGEIGLRLGLTKERVRQIQTIAMSQMRRAMKAKVYEFQCRHINGKGRACPANPQQDGFCNKHNPRRQLAKYRAHMRAVRQRIRETGRGRKVYDRLKRRVLKLLDELRGMGREHNAGGGQQH